MLTFSEYADKKNFHKKPIDQYGKYKVFIVDGEAVRDSSPAAEEFGGSSTYCFIPSLIPKDEIWIEDDTKPEEQKILIAGAGEGEGLQGFIKTVWKAPGAYR